MYANSDRGLTLAGLFDPPTSKSATITSVPWYYTTQNIPANFRSPYNPNPTLNALQNFKAPTTISPPNKFR